MLPAAARWRIAAASPEQHDPAVVRNKHSSVVWKGQLVIFGGHAFRLDMFLGDTFCCRLDTKEWYRPDVQGSKPCARRAHSAAVIGDYMVIFGGFSGDDCLDDIYACDLRTFTWAKLHSQNAGPCPRGGHSAAVDPETGSVLIFGGWDTGLMYHDDVWRLQCDFAGSSCRWEYLSPTSGPRPQGRVGHRAAWDAETQRMMLFGGYGAQEYWSDLWAFDTRSRRWQQIRTGEEGPRGRTYHALECFGGRILVIGGSDAVGAIEDIWTLDLKGGEWEQIECVSRHADGTAENLRGRFAHSSCRDGHRVYMYGGISNADCEGESLSPPLGLVELEVEQWAADASLQHFARRAIAGSRELLRHALRSRIPECTRDRLLQYCHDCGLESGPVADHRPGSPELELPSPGLQLPPSLWASDRQLEQSVGSPVAADLVRSLPAGPSPLHVPMSP